MLLAPAGASAAGSRRIGSKPTLPSGATATGGLPQSTPLSVTVTLQPRDPAALAAYATDVSTPGSRIYHQYLSVSQFAQRFGPTPSAIAAAEASIRAQGLTPGRLAPDGLSFPVTASAGRLSSGFHTGFKRYHLRSGRAAYANTSAPLVTGSGASVVQSVIGLNNLAMEKPQGLVQKRGNAASGVVSPHASPSVAVAACQAAKNAGGYTASQIATAYGLNGLYNATPADLGSGVTVALYELEPYTSGDLTTYQSCYGTSTSVSNVKVGSGATCGGDPSCGLEDELDIEDVIGLVPGASINVYEGPNTGSGAYNTYKQIVTDNTAQVISTSWGMCESQEGSAAAAAENTLFQEAATQGQSIFAAAGDNGTQDCTDLSGNPTGAQAVDDPASQPYVTGVGGTSLSSLSGPLESVWNDGTSGGSGGGGVSTLWPAQSYQSGFAQTQSSISCGSGGNLCREVPDVSADADPNTGYDIYWTPKTKAGGTGWPTNDWGVVGGTSAAAPTWASLFALADASSTCSSSPVGFANPALYAAARKAYGTNFNDITSGNNSIDGVTGFSAGTGYDMASGLGSPRGTALASALCTGIGDSVTFPANSAPLPQTSIAGKSVVPVTLAAAKSNNNLSIAYSAFDLPPGLSINSSTGQISGTPTKPGTYKVTAQAEDTDGNVATQSFTWTVKAPAVTLNGAPSSATGRVGSVYRLASISATDSVGARITYTATGLPAGLSVNPSTGVISGTPTKATNTTVTLKAADAYGGSASRQFKFVVAGAPRISSSKLHISGTRGSLSITVRAGQYAPSIKKLQLAVPRGAHLARGRAPGRYVNAFTLAGKRQIVTRKLSRGKLLVTLKSALSGAQLRLTGSELTFTRTLATGLAHGKKTVKLTLLVTDAAGTQTPLTLTLR